MLLDFSTNLFLRFYVTCDIVKKTGVTTLYGYIHLH